MKHFKNRALSLILSAAMTVTGFMATPFNVKAEEEPAKVIDLQVLTTSDMHGRFMPYDYALDKEDTWGSLAQVSTVVKGLRQENPNTILVDCGDTIQDNSSELFFNEEVHPMIAGMNMIGYDTVTLGNHEFNYGVDVLKKVMGQSKAAVLGGNVYNPDGTGLAEKYAIIEKAGLKIAVIGMVTPNIKRWDAANLKGYTITDPVEETKKVIEEVKDQVDVMIAVEHMGEKQEYGEKNSSVAELAAACPELDLIVAGHEHTAVPGKYYNNILTVENKSGAQTVAKVNLQIEKNEAGKYEVAERTSSLIATKDYQADEEMVEAFKPYHEKAVKNAEAVIGKLSGGNLVPDDEIKGIAQVQLQETAMMNLINQVQMHYSGAAVSAAACFSLNANMKAGNIRRCDTALIYKYDNTLYKLQMTGKQLKKYMEWSASYYNTYKSGDLTVSFNKDIRAYNYDVFAGIRYEVNVAKKPGSRIQNLRKMNGTPIKDTDKIIIAVNNYRANTHLLSYGSVFKEGEALPKLLASDIHTEIGGVRELIGNYIKTVKKGKITPQLTGNWKITGNNWVPEFHAKVVALVKAGKLTVPTTEDGRDSNIRAITTKDIEKLVTISKPATVTKVKAACKKAKTATVSYSAVKYARGYEIMYSQDKTFKKGYKKASTKSTSIVLKSLKSKRKYYVKVRAIKYDLKGKKLYGSYSRLMGVKVK